ncbi:phosphoadenosine phosphosulfate reductase domain-containing protein [Halodesulfurarchaeum formicicum]|nr:phosphoadenosine phosphosulfate reductase family protein [Halodesulfurarchaeum formicicum]
MSSDAPDDAGVERKETHVALCSGGKDSVAATHAAMTFGPAEEVVFLHTRTDPEDAYSAIDATIDWLRDWCDSNDWPFRVVDAPVSYEEIVEEHGYPGPSQHGLMYRRLKDRPIDERRKQAEGVLHCWTGIRKFESDQRMAVAEPEGERGDGRWYWRSPLVDWTDDRVEDYLDAFDLEPAPVVQEMGRSVDCWCGAFGDRSELIDLEAAGFEEHAEWLRSLETPEDAPREQQKWGGYNWDKSDWAAEDDLQKTLCSHCGLAADGGVTDAE